MAETMSDQPRLTGRPSSTAAQPNGVRVLVVDDERNLGEMLVTALGYEGWHARAATSAAAAMAEIDSFRPMVLVLDVMLPDADGFSLFQRIRAAGCDAPAIFLTARDATEDRIRGLTIGGDDYVVKPFSVEELVARLRGLLRRAAITTARSATLSVADLTLDENTREVRRGDRLVNLTRTEFELLRYLMRNSPRVLSKAQILDRVWEYDFGGNGNVVELYVSYLRRKIDVGSTPLIHTVRGVGYVLRAVRR